eukprot:TRINITY_DN20487_c0_g1_i2.p1 TRINITY_DN20487_c0_g1~~TRINITY_DN20487_c0_g1_i2.p1  ORF type:complete len:1375 (+),score=199.18 TRINITY_DN20487_c0_g1_i2:131-4255(+)
MIQGSDAKLNATPPVIGNNPHSTRCTDLIARFPVCVTMLFGIPLLSISLYPFMDLVARGLELDDNALDVFVADSTHTAIKKKIRHHHLQTDGWPYGLAPNRVVLSFKLQSRTVKNVGILQSPSHLMSIHDLERSFLNRVSLQGTFSTATRYFFPSQTTDHMYVLDGGGDTINLPVADTLKLLYLDPGAQWFNVSGSELRSEFVFGSQNINISIASTNPNRHWMNSYQDALQYLSPRRNSGVKVTYLFPEAFAVFFNLGYFLDGWLAISSMLIVVILVWVASKSLLCAAAVITIIIIQAHCGMLFLKSFYSEGRLCDQSLKLASMFCQFTGIPLVVFDVMIFWQVFWESGEVHTNGRRNTLTVPHRVAYSLKNSFPPIGLSLLSKFVVAFAASRSNLSSILLLESFHILVMFQCCVLVVVFSLILPAHITVYHYHMSGDTRSLQKQKEVLLRLFSQKRNNKVQKRFTEMVSAMRENYTYNGCGGALSLETCATGSQNDVIEDDEEQQNRSFLQHNDKLLFPRMGVFWGTKGLSNNQTNEQDEWNAVPSESHLLRCSRRKQLPTDIVRIPEGWSLISRKPSPRHSVLASNSSIASRYQMQASLLADAATFDNCSASPRQTCAQCTSVNLKSCSSGNHHQIIHNHYLTLARRDIPFRFLPSRSGTASRTVAHRIPQVTEVLCDVFSHGADGSLLQPVKPSIFAINQDKSKKKTANREKQQRQKQRVTVRKQSREDNQKESGCCHRLPYVSYWKSRLSKDAPKREYGVFGKRVDESQHDRDRRILSTEIQRPSPSSLNKLIDVAIIPFLIKIRIVVVSLCVLTTTLLFSLCDLRFSPASSTDVISLLLSEGVDSALHSHAHDDFSCGPDCIPTPDMLATTTKKVMKDEDYLIDSCDPLTTYHRFIDTCGYCMPKTTDLVPNCTIFDCRGEKFGLRRLNSCGKCTEPQTGSQAACREADTGGGCTDQNCVYGRCLNNACVCTGSWVGPACDECSETCSTNGACPTEIDSTCHCRGSWKGKHCEQCPGWSCDTFGVVIGCDGVIGSPAMINNCGVCSNDTQASCKYSPDTIDAEYSNHFSVSTILIHNPFTINLHGIYSQCQSWEAEGVLVSCPLLHFSPNLINSSTGLQAALKSSPRDISRDICDEFILIKISKEVQPSQLPFENVEVASQSLEKMRSETAINNGMKKGLITGVVVFMIIIYGVRLLSVGLLVCTLLSGWSSAVLIASCYTGLGWVLTSLDSICLYYGMFIWVSETAHSTAGYLYQLDFSRKSLLSRRVTRVDAVTMMLKRTVAPMLTSVISILSVCISLTFSDLQMWLSTALRLGLITAIIVLHTQVLFPCLLLCFGPTSLYWPAHSAIIRSVGVLIFVAVAGLMCFL